jgi:murein DD-endopeptidase MepM/ murein hydrolase activator NlpD
MICFALLLSAAKSSLAEEPADRFQKVADRLVKAINAEDYPAIRQDFAKATLDALPLDNVKTVFKSMMVQFGKLEKLDPPRLVPPDQAIFVAHFERAVLDLTLVLDQQNKVVGLLFSPPKQAIPVPEKHETTLRLPFDGQWFVFWGGDTKELNHHHDSLPQRFAFDFVMVDKTGTTHQGEGKRNEDYYAFGQPVLAPADGVVTEVISGVRDNTPGSMNPFSAVGNAVMIQHREHEVSVLAHFQQGSIRVKPGERVKRGQVLGLCGNSGNSSEPHVHFHLQNTPIIQDATGIRCTFDKLTVTKDGKSEAKTGYSPIKGDLVQQE